MLSVDDEIKTSRLNFNQKNSRFAMFVFFAILVVAVFYMLFSLNHDIQSAFDTPKQIMPYILLGLALLIALGFEFVNGFHDTANAVATVIYTNSLPPTFAVVWAGVFNFLGVLTASGLVAFGIIALLPVELILQVNSSQGFAMIFALLIAAIVWNLGTWYFGIPASSSHTLVGSIIGVGLGHSLLHGRGVMASIDFMQVQKVGLALLISPLFGFCLAGLLFWLMKKIFAKRTELFESPKGKTPPPLWIRSILIATCTGVSFFHGSNDGQKGMGLMMLILVAAIPMVYGLNHQITPAQVQQFAQNSQTLAIQLQQTQTSPLVDTVMSRQILSEYIRTKQLDDQVLPALSQTLTQLSQHTVHDTDMKQWQADKVSLIRNDMFLVSETIKRLEKQENPIFDQPKLANELTAVKQQIDQTTKFIPTWVKVMVAISLGLGTMVGWRRIVITVGEKIGKNHLTYAQGAAAEMVAMSTIGAASGLGLPVSTTHVLSSGIAGTMVANQSGLQKSTVKSLLMAWVLTLPVTIALAGGLYWLFSWLFI